MNGPHHAESDQLPRRLTAFPRARTRAEVSAKQGFRNDAPSRLAAPGRDRDFRF